MKSRPILAIILILATLAPASAQFRRSEETQTVDTATRVLQEISTDPLRGIPHSLLAQAQAVAIVPDVLKGGFVVGARHGRGVLLIRDDSGLWRAPVFVTLAGGSFGWQIGLQASDVVLVFRTRRSAEALLKGKLSIGADVSVAAGPVGREASAATDALLRAEVYSYAQSRGLFAGLALDGSVMVVDSRSTADYYGPPPMPGQPVMIPASAANLVAQLSRYTERPAAPKVQALVEPAPANAPPAGPGAPAHLARRQLVDAALKLDAVLPEAWKRYLALPAEVYTDTSPPPPDALAQSLTRFDMVARDASFQTLASRPEFRAAHEALMRYHAAARARPTPLDLPPPPK